MATKKKPRAVHAADLDGVPRCGRGTGPGETTVTDGREVTCEHCLAALAPDRPEFDHPLLAKWAETLPEITWLALDFWCEISPARALVAASEVKESQPEAVAEALTVAHESLAAMVNEACSGGADAAALAEARAAVGEGWFAGGVSLAEAIRRKMRMLEGRRP